MKVALKKLQLGMKVFQKACFSLTGLVIVGKELENVLVERLYCVSSNIPLAATRGDIDRDKIAHVQRTALQAERLLPKSWSL